MAHVQVIKKSFVNEETGRSVDYERLAIIGAIDGLPYTLEIKLQPAELIAAKMLLESKSKPEVVRTGEPGEVIPVRVKDSGNLSDDSDNGIDSLFS